MKLFKITACFMIHTIVISCAVEDDTHHHEDSGSQQNQRTTNTDVTPHIVVARADKPSPRPSVAAEPPASAPTASQPAITPNASIEDPETQTQTDYAPNDTLGVPYDPNQRVAFDPRYTNETARSQYDPRSPYYYDDIESGIDNIGAPYRHHADFGHEFRRPYLTQRYQQHRHLNNYREGLAGLRDREGRHQRGERARHGIDRSQRWINYDLYNLIMRTMNGLRERGVFGSYDLEERLYDAIRDRDHSRAVRLHDKILDENREQPQDDRPRVRDGRGRNRP